MNHPTIREIKNAVDLHPGNYELIISQEDLDATKQEILNKIQPKYSQLYELTASYTPEEMRVFFAVQKITIQPGPWHIQKIEEQK
jgi:hypothetical protein